MNKFITTLWIIIVIGTIFVVKNHFSEDTIPASETAQETSDPKASDPEISQVVISADAQKTYEENLHSATTFLSKGQEEKAIKSLEQAVVKNPYSVPSLTLLGNLYLKNNEPVKAEKAFQEAIKLDPTSHETRLGIAKAYLESRKIEAAKILVSDLDQNQPEVKFYTGIIFMIYKDFGNAENSLQQLLDEDREIPTSPELTEKTEKLLAAFEKFSYFRESEPVFLATLLAKALTDVGEYNIAIPILLDAIEKDRNYRDAWLVLGYAYLNTGKALDAIDALQEAYRLGTEKPETLFFLGLAYFSDNQIEEAIKYIEAAQRNGFLPKDQIDLKLAELYTLQQQYEEAEEKYNEVLSVNKNNIDIFIKAIWINIDKLDNPEKAFQIATEVQTLFPETAMSYNLMGWSLTALENYQEAKKYLSKSLQIDPTFDAALLNLGWYYEKQGLTALAREYYKKAFMNGYGNSIAARASERYNSLSEAELQKRFYKVDIASPNNQ